MDALLAYCSEGARRALALVCQMSWRARAKAPKPIRRFENAGIALGSDAHFALACRQHRRQGFLPLDLLARHERLRRRDPRPAIATASRRAGGTARRSHARVSRRRDAARARSLTRPRASPCCRPRRRRFIWSEWRAQITLLCQPLREPQPWRRQWRLWRAARTGL